MEGVLIVGGGIGGLALAGALGRRGVEVLVVDNQPEWSITRSGTALQAPVLRAQAATWARAPCCRRASRAARTARGVSPGMIPAPMATSENVAAGARAVFFSIAYPDPKDGFSTRDAAGVFDQLDALFRAARAVTDPQWLAASAERLGGQGAGEAGPDHAIEPPAPKPAQQPAVRRIHMDWRHIEVATELPWEFIVGGGLVGLVTMSKAVAGQEPRIQVALSQLSLEQADWEARRTDAERPVIDVLVSYVLGRARVRPSYTQIYLGEEDEFEGWTA